MADKQPIITVLNKGTVADVLQAVINNADRIHKIAVVFLQKQEGDSEKEEIGICANVKHFEAEGMFAHGTRLAGDYLEGDHEEENED